MATYHGKPSYYVQRDSRGRGNPQGGKQAGEGRGGRQRASQRGVGVTRPYARRGVGRGSHGYGYKQDSYAANDPGHVRHSLKGSANGAAAGNSSNVKRAKVSGSKDATPSADLLARVAAIRESSERFYEGARGLDSEEEEEEEEGGEVGTNELLKNALKLYYRDLGDTGSERGDPEVDLSLPAPLLMATGSCLVCLSTVKRAEAVWSCVQCYCLFHLQCIQQWARDGVRQQTMLSPDLFPGQEPLWSCPKCRREYRQVQFPEKYHCFCGKQVDPPMDPWLLPHSCGEICDRPLLPQCGHRCVSLCHPGPCLPCPKTVCVTCHCARSPPTVKRCGVRGWSCGRVCGRVLSCEMHTCEAQCHEGVCMSCDQLLETRCQCGRDSQPRLCGSGEWQCTKPCGKLLSCGHHYCEKVCHSESCGECPRSGLRTCPCGKTKHTLPCTEEVPTCGDTCNTDLPCGRHTCMRQCHYGDCGQCLQMAVKHCRCGRKEKAVPCSSEYLCEAKCSRERHCGRHQCKRKCCDGNCPPCEQVCGRALGCRNHKCAAPCHAGRCYPCVLTVDITCCCGSTKLEVPCGRERATKPPKCRELCKSPPSCHHLQRKPHNCHFGPCPPCRLPCGRSLPCGHVCHAPCHSEPKQIRPKGLAPWVKVEPETVVQTCPPCRQLVPKACKGKHEVSEFPCCEVREHSCGRRCGWSLACGNHLCERGCHVIINPPGDGEAGEDCLQCERGCQKLRPPGCSHPCSLSCHQGDCPQCEVLLKLRCYCTTMNLFVKCCEWTAADDVRKIELQSCTSQCTKILSCGHRCPLQCHVGECPKPKECKRKVTLRCPCRRIKKEARCFERYLKVPQCDSECKTILKEKEEVRQREEEARREAEEREQKEQQETLLRQLRPKRRRRKQRVEEEEEVDSSFYERHKTLVWVLGGLTCAAIVGVGVARVWF